MTIRDTSTQMSDGLSMRRAWVFFLPLTLSWIMMFASQPIVQAGLARLPSPELTLAAYSLAFYAAILMESPILMVMPTVNALVRDRIAYRNTLKWIMSISVLLSINGIIVAFVPAVYDFVFRVLLGSPNEIARAANPALKVMSVWPTIVAVRLYYQGILVRFGHTRIISIGTGCRLAAMIIALPVGMRLWPEHGVTLGAATMMLGVVVDGVVVLLAARQLLLQGVLPGETADPLPASRQFPAFCRFFLPLAATSCLHIMSQPIMMAGIARSHQPTLALAAWPVGLGTMWLLSGHLRMLQQVVLSLATDRQSLEVVRRFCLTVAAGVSLIAVVVGFTPLISLYHSKVIGLEGNMLTVANTAMRLVLAMPALIAAQSWAQGLLIRSGQTVPVNVAAGCSIAVSVAVLYPLALTTTVGGHILASAAMSLALLTEALVLNRWARRAARALEQQSAA